MTRLNAGNDQHERQSRVTFQMSQTVSLHEGASSAGDDGPLLVGRLLAFGAFAGAASVALGLAPIPTTWMDPG